MIYTYEGFSYGRKILTTVHYEHHPRDPGDEQCPPEPEFYEITRAFDENGEELKLDEFTEEELELIEEMVEQDYKKWYKNESG